MKVYLLFSKSWFENGMTGYPQESNELIGVFSSIKKLNSWVEEMGIRYYATEDAIPEYEKGVFVEDVEMDSPGTLNVQLP